MNLVLGGLAQSSLLIAELVVDWVRPTTKVIGDLADLRPGFGACALIADVAFDLTPDTHKQKKGANGGVWTVVGFAASLAGQTRFRPMGVTPVQRRLSTFGR